MNEPNEYDGLAVYERADGSIYFNDEGERAEVGFCDKWTTCSGEFMAYTKASSTS